MHPAVNEKIREEMQKAQEEEKELFVLEAALLTEPVYREMLDEIWYIHVPQEIRMERLRSSRGYSDEKCMRCLQISRRKRHLQRFRIL